MEKFPQDVRIAEEKTDGDPDIIDSDEFQPEQKPNIANIFGDQTPKSKKGLGRGRRKATTSDDESTYSRTKVGITLSEHSIFRFQQFSFVFVHIPEFIFEVCTHHTNPNDTKIIHFILINDESYTGQRINLYAERE